MSLLLLLFTLFLLGFTSGQFPAICNTDDNLRTKTCCPNDCGGPTRGDCQNIRDEIVTRWEQADPRVTILVRNAQKQIHKGFKADARYLWPTMVFENVCKCNGNFGGVDCSECDFGWTGSDCNTAMPPVMRKSFASLTSDEKQRVTDATMDLKNEMGRWSVIVEEPSDFSSGRVTLQNVSTYDFFVHLHTYVSRDEPLCTPCTKLDGYIRIDFGHSGPVFPVWHRRYLLIIEKEFQRIIGNDSFGLPYWKWEENDMSPFTEEYYGTPSNKIGNEAVKVEGKLFNNWRTVCDVAYREPLGSECLKYWKPCNPQNDLGRSTSLRRGKSNESAYIPSRDEVKIAIAAASYDAPDFFGQYDRNASRTSFRNRLEGFSIICSQERCAGDMDPLGNQHMHNIVHDWVGGHMAVVPAAINDPIFNLHHTNIDRVLESWMKRFGSSLPAYVPTTGGHPGHNRDDYMVPFFPTVTAGEQYRIAENWGYTYDDLISANIPDRDCSSYDNCTICDASGRCFMSPTPEPLMCPNPSLTSANKLRDWQIGLGTPLSFFGLVTIILILILCIYLCIQQGKYRKLRE